MKFLLRLVVPALLVFTVAGHVEDDHDHEEFITDFRVLSTKFPKPISDHSVTVASNGLAYISGGCDAELGNTFFVDTKNDTDPTNDEGFFVCFSISNSFYSFNATTETFATLTEMPRLRYRHASVAVGDNVWLFGGRDDYDEIITEIDVYNIPSGTWTTISGDVLPVDYQVSDMTGFASGNYVYVVGGYDQNYTAMDNIFRIDTTASSSPATLTIETVANLMEARGDVAVVADGTYAYIAGGFTDDNRWCHPLGSVERLEIATNAVTSLPDLLTPRADKVLVILNERLYALGGETQIENACNVTNVTAGEKTVAVDDVEILEEDHDWEVVSDLPDHRFRSVAIAWDPTDTIYIMGGQQTYDPACDCFRTTDEVVALTETVVIVEPSAAGTLSTFVVGGLVTTLVAFFM